MSTLVPERCGVVDLTFRRKYGGITNGDLGGLNRPASASYTYFELILKTTFPYIHTTHALFIIPLCLFCRPGTSTSLI
jgi:hypothetical protein